MTRRYPSMALGAIWKRGVLILAAAMLAACGGGGGGGNPTQPPPVQVGPDPIEIEGTATAPAGAVARFETRGTLQLALEFFIPPAAAAITGLQPVGGATVELIRIDDDGLQVGEVLATTTTSTTGSYTLSLPENVNLAGNLVVRIQGIGGTQLRAQVVEQAVNISPVSEFVLQKLIDNGVDLENLTTSSIVRLRGRVEEFDLTAGADLSQMLAILQAETGDFVDAQIYISQSEAGDGETVAGAYHQTAFALSLHDSTNHVAGSFGATIEYLQDLTLSDAGDSVINVAISGDEIAEALLIDIDSDRWLRYRVEIGDDSELLDALLNGDRVLSIEYGFEEDLEDDFGWRRPPGVVRMQKAPDANVFVTVDERAAVRYRTTDTSGDGVPDAVDPDQRDGNEVDRGLMILAQKIEDATVTGLAGEYGRIGLRMMLTDNGYVELEVERNRITFDGVGSLDAAEAIRHMVSTSGFESDVAEAETGIPFTLAEDGRILTVGGEPVDGFVGADYGLFVLNQVFATPDGGADEERVADATFDAMLAVKLPLAMLDIQGRTYRVFSLALELDGTATAISNSRFDSLLRVTSPATGELDLRSSYLRKESLSANLSVQSASTSNTPVDISLDADGSITLTVTDEDGTFVAEGYLNEDGSFGVLHSLWSAAAADPTEAGLMLIVEVQ